MRAELTTGTDRRQRLEDLARGIPLVNGCLNLAIPLPRAECSNPRELLTPDDYFARLLGSLFQDPPGTPAAGWVEHVGRAGDWLPDDHWITRVYALVAGQCDGPDDKVVADVSATLAIQDVDLVHAIRGGGSIYGKINHGFWEYLAFVGCGLHGRPYYRPWNLLPAYDRSRFSEVVALALAALHRKNLSLGYPPGTISTPGFGFGLNFTSGDYAAVKDLEIPLHPVVKGAAVGSVSSFAALGGARRWHVSDGCAPKSLFWNDRLPHLCSVVARESDAIVFVVPPHLASIALRGWNGPSATILIPAQLASELWPVVLPTLVGTLDRLATEHRRLTVLAQAGETAALLGILLYLLDLGRRSVLRYMDMGQVLDVAAPFSPAAGPWIRRPDVQQHLAASPPPLELRQ